VIVLDLIGKYEEKSIPKLRQITVEMGEQAISRHLVKGLIELDVTKGREFIRKHKKKTGETLSFTGWIMKCIGQAVSEHKQVHALKRGKKFILFDDVDINVLVERIVNGGRFPVVVVIRKVNEKSFREIHAEIRTAQTQTQDEFITQNDRQRAIRLVSLPKFLRKWFFWRKIRKDPLFVKRMMGTVDVTAVGMFGKLSGWAIPTNIGHSVSFALGGIKRKPEVIEDKIETREYLCLTVQFDHNIVDGAPAARFIARLSELVENAFGLVD
jgi:pyruvate/2-oxoglutarate dehydrogenase complex dihydrolipoamide acyltransferase (E2) component